MNTQALKERFMRVSYNPEISLGNILQVVTILFTVGGAYMALVNKDVQHDTLLQTHTEQIAESKQIQKAAVDEVKQEIKDVKKGVDGINEKLTGVLIENARQSNRR